MVVFVFYILILFDFIVRCSASSPHVIDMKVVRKKYVIFHGDIVANQPFVIHVYSEAKVTRLWCKSENEQNTLLFLALIKSNSTYYASNNVTATTAMNGTWKCLLRYSRSGIDLKFNMDISIKEPELVTESPEEEGETEPALDNSTTPENLDLNTELVTESPEEEGETEPALDNSAMPENLDLNTATSPYIIELEGDLKKGVMLRGDTSPSLVVKQPFTIRIYFDTKVKKVWCQDKRYEKKFFELAFELGQSKPYNYYASKNNIIATKAMEGIWKCTIRIQSDKDEDDDEDKRFEINVDVTEPGGKNYDSLSEWSEDSEEEVLEVEAVPDTHRTPKDLATAPYINATIFRDRKKLLHSTKSMVELNIPFNITLHFKKDVLKRKSITRIICYNTLNKTEIHVNETLERTPGKDDIYTAKVVSAAANMEGNWTCLIKAADGLMALKISFPVIVESPADNPPTARQKTVELYVNNVKIKTEIAGKTEPSIDAKGEYFYSDGELVKITCKIVAGKSIGGMKIAYYYQNLTDKTIVNIDEHIRNTSEQIMHLKLTKEYGSYFTCTQISSPTYAVRLSFFKKTDIISDQPIFQVNGLTLSSINGTDTLNTRIFTYEYYEGEKLHIVGSMANRSSKWTCILGEYSEQLRAITEQYEHINVTVTLTHENLATSSVNCRVNGDRSVRLTLAPAIAAFDPDISGLSLAKTLLKYQKSEHEYFTKYSYIGSMNIHLTCKSIYKKCKWDYNATETLFMDDLKFEENNTNGFSHLSKIMLKPIKTFPKTNVKCICYDSSKMYINMAEIINENFKPEVSQPEEMSTKPPNISSKYFSIEPNKDSSSDESNSEQDKDKPMSTELLIGIILGTVLLVILVAWIIVGIHKRKRRLEKAQDSNLNYENLPEHNKGVMATPAQWDTYSQPLNSAEETYSEPYIEKDIEQMYAKPQPKWKQQPNDTHYAEVGAQEYANIGLQQGTPAYAQVQKMPRNDRFAPQVPLPKTENYAQVLPKTLKKTAVSPDYTNAYVNPTYSNAQATGNSENYAQVLPKNMRKSIAATNNSGYANQTYANAAKSDYAEPAYCEVNSNRTK